MVDQLDPLRAPSLTRRKIGGIKPPAGILSLLDAAERVAGRDEQLGLAALRPLVVRLTIVLGWAALAGLLTRLTAVPRIVPMLVALATTTAPAPVERVFWQAARDSRAAPSISLASSPLIRGGAGP